MTEKKEHLISYEKDRCTDQRRRQPGHERSRDERGTQRGDVRHSADRSQARIQRPASEEHEH